MPRQSMSRQYSPKQAINLYQARMYIDLVFDPYYDCCCSSPMIVQISSMCDDAVTVIMSVISRCHSAYLTAVTALMQWTF